MPVSETDKTLAQAAAAAFGGTPRVDRYHDTAETHHIDVLRGDDRPEIGYSSYSTLGLYRAQNLLDANQVSVELAGVAPSEANGFANAITTAAFNVAKHGWLCAPGVVFPGLISDYGLPQTLPHVLFVPPFPWQDLSSVSLAGGFNVHWLLVVPISDAERGFLQHRRYDILEALFAKHELPYYDLERSSVV